jgi:hypothetical protein
VGVELQAVSNMHISKNKWRVIVINEFLVGEPYNAIKQQAEYLAASAHTL